MLTQEGILRRLKKRVVIEWFIFVGIVVSVIILLYGWAWFSRVLSLFGLHFGVLDSFLLWLFIRLVYLSFKKGKA